MGTLQWSALALVCLAVVEAQYGPLKGSGTRRTTTPFPPGFQSDNQIYNSVSNSISPDGGHGCGGGAGGGCGGGGGSHAPSGCGGPGGCGGGSPPPSGCSGPGGCGGGSPPPGGCSGGACGGSPGGGHKTQAGAASYSDNPWLSGVISQNAPPGSLSPVPCSAPGHVCVPRQQCQGGRTSSPGSGQRQCDASTEVCCQSGQPQSPYQPGSGSSSSSHSQSSSFPSVPRPQPGQRPQPGYGGFPSGQPGQGPSHQPGFGHQPGQQPGQGPSHQPGQRPGQGPSHQPGQQPGQGPSYQPGQPGQGSYRPGQAPGQQPGHGPSHQQPGQGSYQPGQGSYQPGQGSYQPGQPSGQQPGQGPSYQPGQGSYRPGQAPGHSPGQQPGHGPGQQPGHGPSQQPGQGPSYQPGQGSYRPGQAPGQQPGQGPSYQPGQGPSYQPGQGSYRPGQAPGQQPGHGPGQQPGHGPGQGPSYQPGQGSYRPGQAPGQQPGQGPSYQPGQGSYTPGQAPGPQPGQGPSYKPGQQPGQGSSYQPGQGSYQPGQRPQSPSSQPGPGQPGYRPGTNGVPIGGSIYDAGASRPGSSYATPQPFGPYTGPLNTTPHPGCPAALKCVEEIYCDAKGVMQNAPVQLTREEYENKVPLSECQNIETGIIGKCCRDPNYKDPWPDMNNGLFDDGQFHGDHGGHPNHQQPHQFPQQGTSSTSTCGPSATCTPQSQCSGDRQIQPGKQCQVPGGGSTGVCCSKPQFPSYSNNRQINTTPVTPAHRPTPGELYYTPKPPVSNNPFLPENQGRVPLPPSPSNQGPVRPTGISPVNYVPTQPNAIPGQGKDYDYGKQSTPKAPRPTQQPTGASYPSRQPSSPNAYSPSPSSPHSPAAPQHSSPAGQGASPFGPSQSSRPAPTPQPFYPQIATSTSVYSRPNIGQFSSSSQSSHPGRPQTSGFPSASHSAALPGSNAGSPQPPSSLGSVPTSLTPSVASHGVTPVFPVGHSQASPTKGRGPPAGYPFLAPTTEPNRRPGHPATQPGQECGVRRPVQRPNGPSGLETGFTEFPWQAQVLAGQSPLCSGAILSPNAVVTAAHCVDDLRSEDVTVKAGDWKLGVDDGEETKPAQVRKVAAIARHPKYDSISRFYDMAVLILSEPFHLDSHVDVLCLGDNTPPGQKPRGTNCVVTGWGKPSLQNNVPGTTMHSIPVDFIQNNQCEDIFRKTNLGKYFQLNQSFLCAVPVSPNHDLCQVDVGSPIACQKPDGRYELSGIYSWDVGCHQNPSQPVAASNVDKQWVQAVMDKPVEQVRQEEKEEEQKKGSLGFNPDNSDLNKPGFSQGYGK